MHVNTIQIFYLVSKTPEFHYFFWKSYKNLNVYIQVKSRLQIYKQNAEAILSTYLDILKKVFLAFLSCSSSFFFSLNLKSSSVT